jgi:hypothetical protein
MPAGDGRYTSHCTIDVVAGAVSTLDLQIDPGHPANAICLTIASPAHSR